ncbi:MAG: branched-chain amino acid ABC transporter permease [Gammaproteobacteria bacterium]
MTVPVALVAYPWVVSDFFTLQIGAYSLVLGTIALSLMVLAGYGGMVSLAQLTVAGIAGYMTAILGSNSIGTGLNWPLWCVIPAAITVGAVIGMLIGALALRTEGIYTIMITLAVAVAFFYFVRQNYSIFNGFSGFAEIAPPTVMGIYWRDPKPFYYLALMLAAFWYFTVYYVSRSPFGLSLQAIRDNPRRMEALGFHVRAHRIAAYFFAGWIASTAGILLVWFNGRISPGSVGVDIALDILVIAVLGGLSNPAGPYLGAVLFVLLENFAIDLIDRERFNMVIGAVFLMVVFWSPDGLLGIGQRINALLNRHTTRKHATIYEKLE